MGAGIDHDRLYKELLQTFFKEFMELFFPKVSAMIDYSHVKFLSEEVFRIWLGERRNGSIWLLRQC